ncbi:MAG: MBL fold metallo-hydrolase [Candidatus Tectimicrobiota bacterium]
MRYGGNTACVEVRLDDGSLVIFDAGTGIRSLGQALLAQPGPVRAYLFLSHAHWDHIQGIPFFAPAYVPGTELTILGPEHDSLTLEKVVTGQMRSPYFPIPMHAMAAKINFVKLADGSRIELPGGITVEACLVNHPGYTLGYRLSAEGKVLVYTTDNEPFGDLPASRHLAKPSRHILLAHEADLLIQDAQYTPAEYAPHRVGWGHSTYLDALHIAQQAQAKRLVLYHHDPSHTDADVDHIVAQCRSESVQRGLALDCLGAAEGALLIL